MLKKTSCRARKEKNTFSKRSNAFLHSLSHVIYVFNILPHLENTGIIFFHILIEQEMPFSCSSVVLLICGKQVWPAPTSAELVLIHVSGTLLWHICSKQELQSHNRQPLLGNGSAKRTCPLLSNHFHDRRISQAAITHATFPPLLLSIHFYKCGPF
jgi:hypothetical protein